MNLTALCFLQRLTDCTALLYSYRLAALCCYRATDWLDSVVEQLLTDCTLLLYIY